MPDQRPVFSVTPTRYSVAPWMRLGLTCLVLAAATTHAQTRGDKAPGSYPNKPIRIIVGASPGGGTDIVTRIVGQKLAEQLGNPVIIENRGSAVGGILGMDIAARATPDGYTLMAVAASAVLNAELVNRPAYDQRKAFSPIAQMTAQPYLLGVTASLPVQTVGELVALAKAKPGVLNGGSAGVGSMTHLGLELFRLGAGVDIAHIPYKGMGPAVIDLVSGQVQLAFSGVSFATHIKSGKIRALGVTSLQRSKLHPNLPTLAESGVPGYQLNGWYGLLAPTGTPREVITLLNREVVRALNQPDILGRFASDGSEPAPGTPEQFRDLMNREIDTWTRLFKSAKIKL